MRRALLLLLAACNRPAPYWVEQPMGEPPHYVIQCSPRRRSKCWHRAIQLCHGHYEVIEQAKREVRVRCV